MSFLVPDRAKRLWDVWNIRFAVLISLFFQILLIILANSRRRSRSTLLTAIIWSSYLLADWIAAFAVGLISSEQMNDCPEKSALNKQLAAFWAPFLLLHLGGPDAITAFSLEDNELWIRHLLGLVIQLVAVVYVFLQSLSNENEYWIPTVLMIFAGACKYAERTVALYQACLDNFKSSLLPKPDPGPNYAQLMEEFSALEASDVPVKIHVEKEPEKVIAGIEINDQHITLDSMKIVIEGYNFFENFKGLIVDHMFSFHERNNSRMFFLNKRIAFGDAFKVMEVELNFMYDALYTKMAVLHCKIGYLFRFLCTTLMAACFQQFASHPQHKIILFDKIVTYILLVGAVSLDFVGMINLISSDWAIISAKQMVSKVLIRLPFRKEDCSRWSNTVSQHSFIRFCLKERFKWLNLTANFRRIKDILDEFQYKEEQPCQDNLKELIFDKLKAKAMEAESTEVAKEIYSARGKRVFRDYESYVGSNTSISSSLSDEVEYDESLLLWHIATELCYFTSTCPQTDRKLCKVLSEYMLYLLVMRPKLMSAVAGIAQIRFQDTCEEAKRFFQRWQSELSSSSDPRETACSMLLNVKRVKIKPKEIRGDRSKSLLFDACILANDLNKFAETNEERRWKMMSEIWVELLSYAASHCRPDVHARQLSQGGELITFVWLLMVHFGLGEQFRIETGHARAKLIVSK